MVETRFARGLYAPKTDRPTSSTRLQRSPPFAYTFLLESQQCLNLSSSSWRISFLALFVSLRSGCVCVPALSWLWKCVCHSQGFSLFVSCARVPIDAEVGLYLVSHRTVLPLRCIHIHSLSHWLLLSSSKHARGTGAMA